MEPDISKMIEENKGLVYSAIHKYFLSNEPEAESIAFNALYLAAITYDKDNASHAKFSSYAYVCIQNRLGDLIRKMKNKTSSMTILMSDIVRNVDNEYIQERIESDILVSKEDIQLNYEKREECRYVLEQLYKIIDNTSSVRRKEVLTVWLNKYNCQCKIIDLATECKCAPSYARKILLETRIVLKAKLKEWCKC